MAHRALGAAACGLAALLLSGALAAQQVYRYVDADGRVVYSDRPPTGNVKDVQTKRVGANVVEGDAAPLATRVASENYPVTLYSFACGEICQSAEQMLVRRGIPYTIVNVEEIKGAERLKALTGELNAPVLQVGDKLVAKGFNEIRWNALLDQAGYPSSAVLRRPAATPATPPARPPAKDEAAPVDNRPGSGYPRN